MKARYQFLKLILATITLAVNSCTTASQPKIETTVTLEAPIGFYGRVAWFDPGQIAFLYRANIDQDLWETQVYLYLLESQKWQFLEISIPKECYRSVPSFLTRLPGGNLGIMLRCTVVTGATSFEGKGIVYILEPGQETPEIWRQFKGMLSPNDFSLSPDMKQIVMENNGGAGGSAFIAQKTGEREKILMDFSKISSMRWSPDGASIAFAGIKEESTPSFFDPEGFFANWELYLMNADQSNVRSVLSNVVNPYFMKWSPGGRFLTFRGRYDGQDGVFALELRTSKVTKIVSTLSYYDWSPGGTRMVIVELSKWDSNGDDIETQPVFIDLPTEMQDPPK